MKQNTAAILEELILRYPELASGRGRIETAFDMLGGNYKNGGKLLICGNGGSASDSEHIVGELMKSFRFKRRPDNDLCRKLNDYGEPGKLLAENLEGALPAISLCGHPALSTAFSNDAEPRMVFAQQVSGIGRAGDVLMTLSTSGNSENCVLAAITAKALGMKVIAMTGSAESRLSRLADVTVQVPSTETFKVQEYHLPVYHALCAMLEEEFFD